MNYKTLLAAAAIALGSCTVPKQPPSTIEGRIIELTPEEMLEIRGSTKEEFEAYQKGRNLTQYNAVRNALYRKR